jgi:hypothetical protein
MLELMQPRRSALEHPDASPRVFVKPGSETDYNPLTSGARNATACATLSWMRC